MLDFGIINIISSDKESMFSDWKSEWIKSLYKNCTRLRNENALPSLTGSICYLLFGTQRAELDEEPPPPRDG
jgi:hypothetical protein